MILKSGVSVWDALTSIEVSNAVVFVGVACTVVPNFRQGNDQGRSFFTRAFALACPSVAPPL